VVRSMAEVSVIIPTYNRAGFLGRAIGSVLGQTYRDLEVIVVDDGSSDHTAEVVTALDDRRVQYLRHTGNRGAAAARNTGLQHAAGRFIAFQDSDDEWLPEKLDLQIDALERASDKVGVVHTGFSRLSGEEHKTTEWLSKQLLSGDIGKQILGGNFIGTPTALVRRECFERAGVFDTRLPQLEDWEMWIRIAQFSRAAYVDRVLVHTHDLKDSLSADLNTLISAHEYIFKKHHGLFAEDRNTLAAECYWIGNCLCRNGNMQRGREFFLQALKGSPLNLKSLAGILFSCLGRDVFVRMVGLREKIRQR
jgi:glycosyltransferase involved in cell wall biosynthesis